MKDHGILHPELSRVVAAMGHGDLIGVGDAGLPVPPGTPRIDLAFAPGRPAFADVVAAILTELRVEGYVLAEESRSACPDLVADLAARTGGVPVEWVTHEELKVRSAAAVAIVRTGELTPYANVLLRGGVDFDAAAGRAA